MKHLILCWLIFSIQAWGLTIEKTVDCPQDSWPGVKQAKSYQLIFSMNENAPKSPPILSVKPIMELFPILESSVLVDASKCILQGAKEIQTEVLKNHIILNISK